MSVIMLEDGTILLCNVTLHTAVYCVLCIVVFLFSFLLLQRMQFNSIWFPFHVGILKESGSDIHLDEGGVAETSIPLMRSDSSASRIWKCS